jgi:TPP-dependent pyruvate/acetoin dehydrogenase alpha subunit
MKLNSIVSDFSSAICNSLISDSKYSKLSEEQYFFQKDPVWNIRDKIGYEELGYLQSESANTFSDVEKKKIQKEIEKWNKRAEPYLKEIKLFETQLRKDLKKNGWKKEELYIQSITK